MSATDSGPGCEREMEKGTDALVDEFCPPLEAGLVYALASDFDLKNAESFDSLRNTLKQLKESATVEQDLELLTQNEITTTHTMPGAFPRAAYDEDEGDVSSRPSRPSPRSNTDDEDAIAGVATGLSSLKASERDGSDLDDASGYGEASVDFAALSKRDRSQWLNDMFPNVEIKDIEEVLAKCGGDFDKSTDELLNIAFLKENRNDLVDQSFPVPKGIDAFIKDDESRSKGKSKRRRNKLRAHKTVLSEAWASESTMSSGTATPNVWKDLPEDIEFIASRTHLRPKTITSAYHANGARLAPTIRALAIKEGKIYSTNPEKVDAITEWQMDELRNEFGHVPSFQIYGVLMLVNKIPSSAKELLDVMVSSNEQPVVLGKVTGLASYIPIDLSEDDSKPNRTGRAAVPAAVPVTGSVYTTSHLANAQGQAAAQAFQQASAAYRRGKSDHLMGGAAAYYASVGHERIKAAKAVQAAAADAHVASQSSSTKLDLHGVNVSDAVRIAQQSTKAWWEGLGDRKYVVGGRGDGFRIVTGMGRHSADRTSRLGPAVSKMLVRDGWKVAIGTGEIIVSGKARR